jgi:hypothetical protein
MQLDVYRGDIPALESFVPLVLFYPMLMAGEELELRGV